MQADNPFKTVDPIQEAKKKPKAVKIKQNVQRQTTLLTDVFVQNTIKEERNNNSLSRINIRSGENTLESGATSKKNVEIDKSEIFTVDSVPQNLLKKAINDCIPLHVYFSVYFERVRNNILNALTFLKKGENQTKYEIWKELLSMKSNDLIITDGFWLIILKKNKSKFVGDPEQLKVYDLIKSNIKDRMAINYVDYIASCAHIREADKD